MRPIKNMKPGFASQARNAHFQVILGLQGQEINKRLVQEEENFEGTG